MKLGDINPFVRYVYKRYIFNDTTEYIMAYDYRLFYAYKGTFEFNVDGAKFTLAPNNILIVPPATPYKYTPGKDAIITIINFDMDYANSEATSPITPASAEKFDYSLVISKSIYNEKPIALPCDDKALEQIDKIVNLFMFQGEYFKEQMSCLLKTLITSSICKSGQTPIPQIVSNIIEYIKENFNNEITNEMLQKKFSYHPNYMNHIFKKHLKMSIHEYIINYRLTKATILLAETYKSISEIAFMCGFSSTSYFIKKFKEKHGISPRKFKYNQ